jgi:short-subunit dehydrogenase
MAGGEGSAPTGPGEDPVPRRQRDTVLITGASSGIGRELARLFAADGSDLVLVARSEDRLREIATGLTSEYGVTVQVLAADLTRPDSAGEIAETLTRQGIAVDTLVNNAGFGGHGQVATLGAGKQAEMIEVNVTALTRLTAMFLPGMLERRHGAVLNVASTAAFQPGPNQAVYCATKAYVLSFTEALADEVRGSGVRVSCLAPGATETGFAERADMAGTRAFKLGAMGAGPVAQAGHDGLRQGKTLVIPGLRNRAMAFAVRLAPRALVTRIAGYIQA